MHLGWQRCTCIAVLSGSTPACCLVRWQARQDCWDVETVSRGCWAAYDRAPTSFLPHQQHTHCPLTSCHCFQAEAERQKLAKVPGMLNPYENNEDMNNSD